MNGQNNNYNNQNNQNNQNNNSNPANWNNNRPAQNIQNQYYNNQVNNVGSMMSNRASNKVISWGVGQKSLAEALAPKSKAEMLFDDNMINQVNGTVQQVQPVQPEILDETFDMPPQMPQQSKVQPVQQPQPKNNQVPQGGSKPSNFMQMLMTPTGGNNNDNNVNNNPNIMPGEWMNNQPLSGGKLGVNTIDASKEAKDTKEKGKFFSIDMFAKKKKEKVPVQQSVKPQKKDMKLEDPLPEVDFTMLTKSYIGDEFTKLNMSIFSFSAFILKGAYFIYRKFLLLGLASFAIEMVILTQLRFEISVVVYLAYSFILALVANPICLALTKSRVKSIRMRKKNKKKTEIELESICRKKGGTNTILAVLTFVAFTSGVIYLSMYEFPNSLLHTAYKAVVEYNKELETPKYDGYIDRLTFDVAYNLDIKIPDEFKKEPGKIYRYLYAPDGKEEVKSCSLSISAVSKFYDPQDFIEQYKKYEKLDTKIEEFKKGKLHWYSLSQTKKSYDKKMNVTLVNHQVVLFEYQIGLDTEPGVCEAFYDDIFDSISLKNN